VIVGDIFISAERIKENAAKFKVAEATELHRVMIHGALHLLGYKDKTAASKNLMTQMEDKYLAKRSF
jgi:probable rRNA maturation factor